MVDDLVLIRQRKYLWIKGQSLVTEIGPGHKLTEHELVKDEYMRNVRSYDNLEQIFQQENLDKSNHENLQHISRET